jgi:hypothetical protein
MAMAEIVRISYEYRGALNLRLHDPETNEDTDVTAVDVEVTNMLAIDSAFERRVPVIIGLDEDNRIIRVQTDGPARDDPLPPPPVPGGLTITRIATQRGDTLFAEIFYVRELTDPVNEKQVRTTDPLIHIICHGAFLSQRQLKLTLDESEIKGVVKERFP